MGSQTRIVWREPQAQFPHQWALESSLWLHCMHERKKCRPGLVHLEAAASPRCQGIPPMATGKVSVWSPNPETLPCGQEGRLVHPSAQNSSTHARSGVGETKRNWQVEITQGYRIMVGFPGSQGQVLHVLSFTEMTSLALFAISTQ